MKDKFCSNKENMKNATTIMLKCIKHLKQIVKNKRS